MEKQVLWENVENFIKKRLKNREQLVTTVIGTLRKLEELNYHTKTPYVGVGIHEGCSYFIKLGSVSVWRVGSYEQNRLYVAVAWQDLPDTILQNILDIAYNQNKDISFYG